MSIGLTPSEQSPLKLAQKRLPSKGIDAKSPGIYGRNRDLFKKGKNFDYLSLIRNDAPIILSIFGTETEHFEKAALWEGDNVEKSNTLKNGAL